MVDCINNFLSVTVTLVSKCEKKERSKVAKYTVKMRKAMKLIFKFFPSFFFCPTFSFPDMVDFDVAI